MKRVLLTGAGGFVGHHILEHILVSTDWEVVATDSFRHRGTAGRIVQVLGTHYDWMPRLKVITHDLCAPFTPMTAEQMGDIDYVLAVASESHVDRSIYDPVPFVRNNVDVALNTLELCRQIEPQAVIWISTDEVYGPEPLVDDVLVPQVEWSPIIPSNPYSASKAAQEAMCVAWWRTYGVPVVIVNIMNIIGERQHPEKFIPMLIRGISHDAEVTIHGREGEIGSRHYLHARNVGDALVFLLREPPALFQLKEPAAYIGLPRLTDRPDRWNIVGPDRIDNLELARMIARIMGKPLRYRLMDFHSARPGHDPHYGLDGSKLAAAGWKPPVPFAESLEHVVKWTLAHPEWLT